MCWMASATVAANGSSSGMNMSGSLGKIVEGSRGAFVPAR